VEAYSPGANPVSPFKGAFGAVRPCSSSVDHTLHQGLSRALSVRLVKLTGYAFEIDGIVDLADGSDKEQRVQIRSD